MNETNLLIDFAGEAASDKADWIEQEADDLFYRIDRHQAYEILDEAFAETDGAYVDTLRAIAHWITCAADAKTLAHNHLVDTIEKAMRPALVKMATENYDELGGDA